MSNEKSDELHGLCRQWVREFASGDVASGPSPDRFRTLGDAIVRYQVQTNAAYARFVESFGVDPKSVTLETAPAVPTEVFKNTFYASFAASEAVRTFRTSGTSGARLGARGAHAFRDLRTYAAASVAFGRAALLHDLLPHAEPAASVEPSVERKRPDILVLGPGPQAAADSSLTYMFEKFVEAFSASNEPSFFLDGDIFDLGALDERVSLASILDRPILVLGTSFAFVHFLDALGDFDFPLPQGSRVMQTGGYKGRSRVVEPHALKKEIARAFRVPERSVVSEYGMTELSSQFYEFTAVSDTAKEFVYREPPWARVVPVDPETLRPVATGEVGIARIEDLLNVDSAVAILTHDRVRRVSGGFELLGRALGAPPRGCSLGIDELLRSV